MDPHCPVPENLMDLLHFNTLSAIPQHNFDQEFLLFFRRWGVQKNFLVGGHLQCIFLLDLVLHNPKLKNENAQQETSICRIKPTQKDKQNIKNQETEQPKKNYG